MIDAVLITGGGSGIGRACALKLASRNIHILLVGRSDSIGQTANAITQAGGKVTLFNADLSESNSWNTNLNHVINSVPATHWGAVLAGSMLDPHGEKSTASDYATVFSVNVVGNLAVLEACLPKMTLEKFGRAVFFAGGGAAYAYPAFPAYALSKVSTVRLVENLAAKYASIPGLSFVCLAPGAVETPMLSKVIAAGGEVKTKTDISEPVTFVDAYLHSDSLALNGRYVHVRDPWSDVLTGSLALQKDQFLLRRIQ